MRRQRDHPAPTALRVMKDAEHPSFGVELGSDGRHEQQVSQPTISRSLQPTIRSIARCIVQRFAGVAANDLCP